MPSICRERMDALVLNFFISQEINFFTEDDWSLTKLQVRSLAS
ncbi:MAG: hypothetical protein ACYT04_44045 [Nostoc sp.]